MEALMEILSIILIVLAIEISLVAYLTIMTVIFGRRVEQAQQIMAASPWRSFLAGVLNFLFFGAIALALNAVGGELPRLLAVIVLTVLVAVVGIGLAGLVNLTGQRLSLGAERLKMTAWGTVTLSLACALPVLGWFVLLPGVIFVSLGAVILGFFQRK
jgi:glucan phosphoethanolaminetransferase (alkaline phosphatase superfamily)